MIKFAIRGSMSRTQQLGLVLLLLIFVAYVIVRLQ